MSQITPKQREILDAIRQLTKASGQPPTVREIGAKVNLKSSCSVQRQLETLQEAGKIRRGNFKYRSIEIVGDEKIDVHSCPSSPVPLLGRISGGTGIEAMQALDAELLTLPHSLLPRFDQFRQQEACETQNYFQAPLFALKVKGDSMIGVGIDDGDIVVARQQSNADNGDIVVALIEENLATVKKFYRENGRIRLQPANDLIDPLFPEYIQVLGKVALSIKQF